MWLLRVTHRDLRRCSRFSTLSTEDRVAGSLMGLACGDALGAPVEGKWYIRRDSVVAKANRGEASPE
jgi:hypothetical protein